MEASATLAADVVRRLAERGLRIATAESSTGGLAGHLIVTVPGASRVFAGGVAAYDLTSKLTWLHVPEGLVAEHGSVQEATTLAMARGARDVLAVDLAAAESGVAEDNDNPERPGGLWWIAIIGPGNYERAERHLFEGNREARMHAAARRMLTMVLEYLDDPP
ncbi:MAG: CinA family protein [Chloroflexi bacterium]|nr:CinA family protein [Chloroflexota bacterium]MQC19329.1 CinA family protein [Chloroflexota bacterium]